MTEPDQSIALLPSRLMPRTRSPATPALRARAVHVAVGAQVAPNKNASPDMIRTVEDMYVSLGNTYDYFGKADKDPAEFLQLVAEDTVKKFYGR